MEMEELEFYIGQTFSVYPPEAATWCDHNNATIVEKHREEETEYGTVDVRYYEICAIEPHIPTYEEVDAMRVQYRHEHIDDRTIARMRKQANGTWTDEDEQEYLALDAEVTAYIEENYPYPVGE